MIENQNIGKLDDVKELQKKSEIFIQVYISRNDEIHKKKVSATKNLNELIQEIQNIFRLEYDDNLYVKYDNKNIDFKMTTNFNHKLIKNETIVSDFFKDISKDLELNFFIIKILVDLTDVIKDSINFDDIEIYEKFFPIIKANIEHEKNLIRNEKFFDLTFDYIGSTLLDTFGTISYSLFLQNKEFQNRICNLIFKILNHLGYTKILDKNIFLNKDIVFVENLEKIPELLKKKKIENKNFCFLTQSDKKNDFSIFVCYF